MGRQHSGHNTSNMHTLTLEYRRFGFRRKLTRKIPETWNEMTAQQFVAIVSAGTGAISESQFFRNFYGIPVLTNLWYLYRLTGLAPSGLKKAKASRFLIPSIGYLFAPCDNLIGVSLQQFMTADTFFAQAAVQYKDGKFKSCDALCRFIGSLYIGHNETWYIESGDRKHRLVDINKNADIVAKAPDNIKMAVFVNWGMIRNWLSSAYPLLFPSMEDLPKQQQKKQKSQWLTVFDNFVGNDVSRMQEYQKMECTDAFRIMNRRIMNYNKELARRR